MNQRDDDRNRGPRYSGEQDRRGQRSQGQGNRDENPWRAGNPWRESEHGGYFDSDENDDESVFATGNERDYGPTQRGYGPSGYEGGGGYGNNPGWQRGRGRDDRSFGQQSYGQGRGARNPEASREGWGQSGPYQGGGYTRGGAGQSGYPGSGYGQAYRGSGYGQSGSYQGGGYQGGGYGNYAASPYGGSSARGGSNDYGGSSLGGYGGRSLSGAYGAGESGDYGRDDAGGSQWRPGRGFGSNEGNDWSTSAQRGMHRGVGPSGYARSDERIKEEVSEALTDHDEVDASQIEVNVKGGEVTLTGTVPERPMKRFAEIAAERVRGVKDVHNQIRVQAAGQAQSSGSSNSNRGLGTNLGSGQATSSQGAGTQVVGNTSGSTSANGVR